MEGMIRRRVLVSGRVQGVWFRDTCSLRAQELGVAGWVRNMDDGRVEAVFEGEAPAVASMVAWCDHGPPRARVETLEVHHEEPQGDSGFTITG